MAKLTDSDILSIITNEMSNANITVTSAPSLQEPLKYYLGMPLGTEQEGRSSLISSDLCDSIEWIMPQIMRALTHSKEVVCFDPINEQDELQAQIETDYIYDVIFKQNNGFELLHTFVKDSLLQRNGILKVYFEDASEEKTYSYTGLNEDQLNIILSEEKNAELLELSPVEIPSDDPMQPPIMSFDVKIKVSTDVGKICIDPVAPEEFRVNSQHNSVSLANARFTCHIVNKSLSDLREEGYKDEDIDNLMSSDLIRSSYRFNYQGETTQVPSFTAADEANKLVEISECYLKLDMDGTGITELMKITVGGVDTPTVILSKEAIDSNPWISTTAILMSHKFQGLSIFDRLKSIQDNKTAIIRNIMDNMYLQNNQRYVVLEGQVNLDDAINSKPGSMIRAKRLDAIMPLVTPALGSSAFDMMRYLDEVRAGRTGVSADGTASPEDIGDGIGSQGVARIMTAKEELVGLIIRVICETGIKPLCEKIRDLVTEHVDTIQDFKFRGQWVKVNPATWPTRTKSTVRVGTGTGDTQAKLMAIQQIQMLQEKIMAIPGQALTNPAKIYATIDDFCKFSGLDSANKYFVDPNSPQGQQQAQQAGQQQQQQQQQAQQAQMEQMRMQAELAKSATTTAEAQMANVQLKGQVELGKHQREMEKQTSSAEIASLKMQLDEMNLVGKSSKEQGELQFKYDELEARTSLELTKLEATTKAQEEANYRANEEYIDKDNYMESEPEMPSTSGVETERLVSMIDNVVKTQGAMFDALQQVAATKSSPAKPVNVVRDADGNILRLE